MSLEEDRRRNFNKKVDPPLFLSGYADASWKHDTPGRGGGWGAWVRDGNHRIHASGPSPDWVGNSGECELAAVCAAAYLGMGRLDTDNANIMVVKTDNQQVCRWFGYRGGGPLPKNSGARDTMIKVLTRALELDIKLVVTWVKGHQGTRNTQGYLNEQVDGLARKARLSGKRHMAVYPIRDANSRAPSGR